MARHERSNHQPFEAVESNDEIDGMAEASKFVDAFDAGAPLKEVLAGFGATGGRTLIAGVLCDDECWLESSFEATLDCI